jgi:hypothetical protein
MTQTPLLDIGPRTSGATCGMRVRSVHTGQEGTIEEIGERGLFSIHCLYVGDVAVAWDVGGLRVCGPETYFWTQFELCEVEGYEACAAEAGVSCMAYGDVRMTDVVYRPADNEALPEATR